MRTITPRLGVEHPAIRNQRGVRSAGSRHRRTWTQAPSSTLRGPPGSWVYRERRWQTGAVWGSDPGPAKYGGRLGPVRYLLADLFAWRDASVRRPPTGEPLHA